MSECDCRAWVRGGHGKKNLMNLLMTFHLHTSSGLLFLAITSRRGKFVARSPCCYFTFCKMFLHTRRQHGEPTSYFFFGGGEELCLYKKIKHRPVGLMTTVQTSVCLKSLKGRGNCVCVRCPNDGDPEPSLAHLHPVVASLFATVSKIRPSAST